MMMMMKISKSKKK